MFVYYSLQGQCDCQVATVTLCTIHKTPSAFHCSFPLSQSLIKMCLAIKCSIIMCIVMSVVSHWFNHCNIFPWSYLKKIKKETANTLPHDVEKDVFCMHNIEIGN